LTLTSRHHPEIVSRLNLDNIATAEYYANATEERVRSGSVEVSLEKAQAMLFLGFHRWSATRIKDGRSYMRLATHYVQDLGCQKEDEEKDTKKQNSLALDYGNESLAQQEDAISREICRRTFWSCFILDRYASGAKNQAYMIDVDDIATQLPCSDEAFNKGLEVKTPFLGESDDDKYRERRRHTHSCIWDDNKWEDGKCEALSLYIQTMSYFGRVLSWSLNDERQYVWRGTWVMMGS
jgi:hypothetical protein